MLKEKVCWKKRYAKRKGMLKEKVCWKKRNVERKGMLKVNVCKSLNPPLVFALDQY